MTRQESRLKPLKTHAKPLSPERMARQGVHSYALPTGIYVLDWLVSCETSKK